MADRILPIPPIPDGLREAAQRGKLVIFIGAGVSRIAGCPSWSEFADGTLRSLVEQGKFSHGQLAQINHLHPRVKLTIALRLRQEHKIKIDFTNLLHPSGMDNPKGRKLYANLCKLGKKFVTTNYDEWLDEEIVLPELSFKPSEASSTPPLISQRKVVYKIEEIIAARLNEGSVVIHLHGSVRDPDGMILTTQDYLRHYANDRNSGDAHNENRILTFLDYLFREKTVLFIGYGLEELEILEYVILKARRVRGAGPEAKHYLIQGFFAHEYELLRSLTGYYLECGIELISYLRDQKDWDQLLELIEEFARLIPASDLVLEELKQMEGLLDD